MNFKIKKTIFRLDNNAVYINNQLLVLKKATREALILFLQSKGNIVSKDDLLNHIWKDVIVSDASAFKQVQLVKEIFTQAGLPKDTIENIYGKSNIKSVNYQNLMQLIKSIYTLHKIISLRTNYSILQF